MALTICLFGFLAATVALCAAISRTRRSEDRELDQWLQALRSDMESTSDNHPGCCSPGKQDTSPNPGGHRLSHDVPTLALRNRWDLPLSHHEQPAAEQFPLPGSETPLFSESR